MPRVRGSAPGYHRKTRKTLELGAFLRWTHTEEHRFDDLHVIVEDVPPKPSVVRSLLMKIGGALLALLLKIGGALVWLLFGSGPPPDGGMPT